MDRISLRPFDRRDIDWLTERHATLYAQDEGFDDTFRVLVRTILIEFAGWNDPACERGWIAEGPGGPLGSIFCVRQDADIAKLRLFLLVPEARGLGLGRRMLRTCMEFARGAGYKGMTLWTHESHRAACALYRSEGWELISSQPVQSFGQDLVEQHWSYRFGDAGLS